jgi:hypothetical protein
MQWLGQIERFANTVANGDPLLSRMQGDRLIDASGLCSPCAPDPKTLEEQCHQYRIVLP